MICTIQYFQYMHKVTQSSSLVLKWSHCPVKKLCVQQLPLFVPPSSSSWQLVVYFWFPWICLFQAFHINRTQYVVFCIYLLCLTIFFQSSFVLQHVSELQSFLQLNNIPNSFNFDLMSMQYRKRKLFNRKSCHCRGISRVLDVEKILYIKMQARWP